MITNLIYKFKNNLKIIFFTSFLLGALSTFSLPPYNFFYINFFTLSLLFLILTNGDKNIFINFLIGWFFGFGYFLLSLYWISNSLTFEVQFQKLIPISLIFIPFFLAIFYGLATMLTLIFKLKKNISSLLLFSSIFSFIEFSRGHLLSGFPWNLIVYSIESVDFILQILPLIGTYSLNLIVITLFITPVVAFIKIRFKQKIIFLSIIFTTIASISLLGKFESKKDIFEKKLETKIKIMSPQINLKRYFDNPNPELRIKDLIKLSDPIKDDKILFIFPEGILSGIYLEDLLSYKYLFKDSFSDNHKFIFGISSKKDQKIYNSLILFDNNLNIIHKYDKNNLVPFGEFLPLENLLTHIGLKKITQGYTPFSFSNERDLISLYNIKILPLICYEIIYSGKISKNNADFDLILNISEDGWFGDTIGPYQHFSHSLFRSIEEGKTLIRSANNGISALIDPVNGVKDSKNLKEKGVISLNSVKIYNKTLFSLYGNKIFFYLMLFYISFIFILKRKDL